MELIWIFDFHRSWNRDISNIFVLFHALYHTMFLYPFCNIYFSWALLTKISQRILMNRAYSLFSRSTGAASLSTMACLNSLVLFPWSECAKTPFSQSGAHPFGIAFSATSKFLAWKLCFTSVSFWIRIAYINRQKKLAYNCDRICNLSFKQF